MSSDYLAQTDGRGLRCDAEGPRSQRLQRVCLCRRRPLKQESPAKRHVGLARPGWMLHCWRNVSPNIHATSGEFSRQFRGGRMRDLWLWFRVPFLSLSSSSSATFLAFNSEVLQN